MKKRSVTKKSIEVPARERDIRRYILNLIVHDVISSESAISKDHNRLLLMISRHPKFLDGYMAHMGGGMLKKIGQDYYDKVWSEWPNPADQNASA